MEVIEVVEREVEVIELIERGPAGPTGPQPDINYTVVSSSRTLEAADLIAADTSGGAFTITLPLNPSNGDAVDIFDFSETFDTNPLTIARNGSRIESLEENLVCNVEGAYFTLIYTGATRGWQVLPRYGTSGGSDSTLTTQGDMLYRGAAVNTRLPIGSAGQVLKVNSGATAPEWGAAPATGVTSVSGTTPIVSSGGATPTISISAATTGAAGSMSSGDKTKLDAITGTNTGDQTITLTGNVTGSGTGSFAATIANDAVDNTKLSNMAQSTLKGRVTASTGDPEDLSASQVRTILNVADGAEVNVQANWTEASSGSDAFIQNKPTLGGAAALNVGTTAGTVAAGDDARLSDARTPTSHSHGNLTNAGAIGSTSGLPVVTTTSGAITTLPLGTANQVLKVNSGATAVEFGEGGGIDDYTVITSSQTATNGARIAADTTASAFTVTLPASPANGDTVSILDYAGTFDTNNLTIARNGSNIESLAENMDANIEDAAFSLVYVGAVVGWKVVPYFGAKTNLASAGPIGSTIPSTGAFTTLTATTLQSTPVGNTGASTGAFTSLTASTITGPLGATVGSTSAAAIAVGHANSGIYVNSNQIVFMKQGVECMFFDNSSRVNVNTTGGLQIVQTDAPIIFSRAISLFPDAANGTLAQRNGTQAQTFRIYNTFTSATNFERCNIIAQSAGSVIIGTEKGSGGGTARGMELRTDNVARINISATGGIGFFGAAAAAQPTAVADATDAASVITQLNALLSRMRTLGLIAT